MRLEDMVGLKFKAFSLRRLFDCCKLEAYEYRTNKYQQQPEKKVFAFSLPDEFDPLQSQ